ncbi:high choriolytic enzyme 1, partial [Hyalella azteca]|uniref:Metalloendopeptidase n=1 Tax=Hyalella azteca TaxID=294128 RepID=A0A8B7NRY0_HYAAZ
MPLVTLKIFQMATRKTLPTILTLCLSLCVASINATPMDMPPREDGSVLVGDIAYSAEEWESLLAKNLQSLKILWPKTNGVVNIPYKISNPEVNTALMEQAFSAWESKTCVKFSKMAESDKRLEYLDFMIKGYCYSYLGYRKGITTPVSLPSSCTFKAFEHELGHSMGLRHEMNRSDRDKHIIVISGVKYKPGLDSQFALMNTINFDIPYDYCSIMHYKDKAGSEHDDEHTMLALDARFQTLMGWCSTNISHWNYKLVNTMYNCTDDWLKACKQASEPCKN